MHIIKRRLSRAAIAQMNAIALLVAIVLSLGGVIGGSVAWLITKTSSVTNTFTYGDINIELKETDTQLDEDEDPNTNTYKMIPGQDIAKDPVVTVKAGSEDCWLFVELEKSGGTVSDGNASCSFDSFLEYSMEDGWTELDGVQGVYYRQVSKSDTEQEFGIIKGDIVTVKSDVTKGMLNALDAGGVDKYPALKITAYAVQRDGEMEAVDTAAEAWLLGQGQYAP